MCKIFFFTKGSMYETYLQVCRGTTMMPGSTKVLALMYMAICAKNVSQFLTVIISFGS